jgi:hypothetical protein
MSLHGNTIAGLRNAVVNRHIYLICCVLPETSVNSCTLTSHQIFTAHTYTTLLLDIASLT